MDNTALNPASGGDTVRTLDRTGLGLPKTEVVQLDAAGNSGNVESLVSSQNPLPVQSGFDQLRAALALQAAAYLAAQPQNGFTPLELPAFLTQLSNPAVYPQINAEAIVGVVPINTSYPPFNLLRYGADRTGAVASDAAMTSAIAVCGGSGGTIYAPNGTYSFASPINLNLKNGITILGDGGVSSGLIPGTRIQYTGTVAPFITMNGSQGGALREVQLVHTNVAFAGPYLQANALSGRDASEIGTFNCEFGTNSDPVIHLDINTSDGFHANRCVFQFGNPSVSGALVGGYCNNASFTDCEWFNCTGVPIQASGPCQAWLFSGCIFEYLPGPQTAGAILSTASTGIFVGLTVQGCWFGDVPASGGGSWIDIYGQNLVATGNYISGNTGAPLAATAITLRSFAGAVIMGNTFSSFLNGINFATASMQQIVVKGNTFNSVTNAYVNPANVLAGLNEFWPNFGTGTLVPTGMTIPPPSAGNNLILNGPSGAFAQRVNGNSASGNSLGVQILAGSTTADSALQVFNQAISKEFFDVRGDGSLQAATSALGTLKTKVATGLAGFRASDNTATSNATLTADAQLTLTFNETGHFALELWLAFWEVTLGTGGFQFDLGSGTATVAGLALGLDGFTTAAIGNAGITTTTTASSAATIATSAAAPSWFIAKGWVNISVAGTLAVRWAQASSSANATTLLKGSYIKVLKIG